MSGARFTSLYAAVYADLVRFAQRRTHPDHAEDVVAEALTVVWRRLDEVPRGEGDARAWIFGITRNILLNEHRGTHRRRALSVRLAETADPAGPDPGTETVLMQVDLSRAWALLSEVHQERCHWLCSRSCRHRRRPPSSESPRWRSGCG